MKVGQGFDSHRLVAGRPLILGGVNIPHETGLDGHSDADVLVHAICDALLGAAGWGDIGRHFPDTDQQYSGRNSRYFLVEIRKMLDSAGLNIGNIDATVIAQAPRLSPYMEQMTGNLAADLGVARDSINLKATTTEGLGFTGRGEGIAALAVALIE
ncbi:MAG: 2-C-methyl-D-erythritol 2,4-cyclodiphosphate synthase [Gemmatimonadetes bacterium]|nr:2-C-methyl-D-erythritol 2,4-cyclodiphosphate synthase [Gemmatimonadota bacterium]